MLSCTGEGDDVGDSRTISRESFRLSVATNQKGNLRTIGRIIAEIPKQLFLNGDNDGELLIQQQMTNLPHHCFQLRGTDQRIMARSKDPGLWTCSIADHS